MKNPAPSLLGAQAINTYCSVGLYGASYIYLPTCQRCFYSAQASMTPIFISLVQVSCTVAVGWLLAKWMAARRAAREITSVTDSYTFSLVLTPVVRQLVSTSGRHLPYPSIPFSWTCIGLNLSIQRTDGVFLL